MSDLQDTLLSGHHVEMSCMSTKQEPFTRYLLGILTEYCSVCSSGPASTTSIQLKELTEQARDEHYFELSRACTQPACWIRRVVSTWLSRSIQRAVLGLLAHSECYRTSITRVTDMSTPGGLWLRLAPGVNKVQAMTAGVTCLDRSFMIRAL